MTHPFAGIRPRLSSSLLAAIIAVTSAAWQVPAHAQQGTQLATQTSESDGVTVKVTPARFSASEWTFTVVFDTHSQNLTDDLQNNAVLLVDGIELHPAAWTAPSGGHHREGTLSFAAPSQRPRAVELRITRANEAAPRVFRWDGSALP